jgi:16S rRNA C967 or C1407 C5-methylase (RsmB/RsmF family)/NOL1/NOP2/fmu family ribosome biogenesis protein
MGLPPALLASLENVKGFNRDAFEQVHASGEKITSIRLNSFKHVSNSLAIDSPVPWCPDGYYLSARPSFTLDPLFHARAYYVQEASSMFLWYVIQTVFGADTKKKVLDLCAAPGGKTTLLASFFNDGLLVANEVIKSRASILVENVSKWGSTDIVVSNNDPAHFQSLPAYFDLIVADAPCSGSGLFRKDPEAITEWSPDNVQLCSQRQQRILSDVLPALKEEGILIYSTCSYSVEEDEAIAEWLISDMEMEGIPLPVPDEWGIVETVSAGNRAFGYRFYPDRIKGEGFFIAVFRKKKTENHFRYKELQLTKPLKKELQIVEALLNKPAGFDFFKQGDAIRFIKTGWFGALQTLAASLYIKKAGIEIGSVKGQDLVPSHELAMAAFAAESFPLIPLTEQDALYYLRRKEIFLNNAPKGWNMVGYNGLPLGWVKVLPNRVNNYYPAEWRILKE